MLVARFAQKDLVKYGIVDVRIENVGTLRNPVVKRKYAGETAV